ncbi:signal peptidase complex subunit spc2 [Oleoguttula sp. CCFEE 5521]
MAESKISPYNLADLKNTTDDALGNYMRSLGFQQDNKTTDIKLAVGYVGGIIAAATFAADYKLGWEATKTWTAVAVFAYMVLNGFYSYWVYFVEKGLVFEGTKSGKHVSIASKTNKHEPTYYLTITTNAPSTDPRKIQAPFPTWFTADGFFVAKPFQQWLASSVGVIGDADAKNAMRDQRDELASPKMPAAEASVPEHIGNGTVESTGIESKGKSGKRSKRK